MSGEGDEAGWTAWPTPSQPAPQSAALHVALAHAAVVRGGAAAPPALPASTASVPSHTPLAAGVGSGASGAFHRALASTAAFPPPSPAQPPSGYSGSWSAGPSGSLANDDSALRGWTSSARATSDGDGASAAVRPAKPFHGGPAIAGPLPRSGAAAINPSRALRPWLLSRHDAGVALALLAVALFTRFYRLDRPNGVVFDETHFGRFTGQYHAGTYLFDIHPPLGKLVFWGIGKLLGYEAGACRFTDIGLDYAPNCYYMQLRTVSALFGSLTVPLQYYIARYWRLGTPASVLAALLLNFDGLNTGESRLILMDAQLMFWCTITLLSAIMWWERVNRHNDATLTFLSRYGTSYTFTPRHQATDPDRLMTRGQWYGWLLWMGVMCGNAVSVKWTGLATPGLIAIESFFAIAFLENPINLLDGMVIAGTAASVYASYFWVHFALLPRSGDGDGFAPIEFQRTLIGNANYDAAASRPNFLFNFLRLNFEMLSANSRILQRHNWESFWYEWPVNSRGILYYSKDTAHTYTSSVYLLGNPVAIWVVTAALALVVPLVLLFWRYRRYGTLSPHYAAFERWAPHIIIIIYCASAYACNMLPYVFVARSCFIYHYMPALAYGQLVTAAIVDALAGRKHGARVVTIMLAAIITSYVFFSPWIYATPLTGEAHARRRWLRRWD